MRILLDQGTPVPLRKELVGHEVATAFELGWAKMSNGELLRQAETQFDLFITTDKNLSYQQNLAGRRLAILVLPTTSWPQLKPSRQQIAQTALTMKPGSYHNFRLPD
jgi:hypothetical protein